MKRRIFRLGKSTLVASLPSKWAKKHNLTNGDELDVVENDRSITFSTEKEYSQSEIEIDIKDLNKDMIRWYITCAYVRGFDKIKILFEKQENMSYAQEIINSLFGIAIIEQGNSYCVAGELSVTTDAQFDNILRRIFLLIISIAEDTLTALVKGDKESLKLIERRDLDVDQFTNFCLRILNKKGYKEYNKTAVMYDLIQELEELCDNYEGISDDLLGVDSFKIRNELKSLFQVSNESIRLFYELFYKFNKEKVLEVHNKRQEIIKRIKSLKSIKPYERTIIYHIRKINDDLCELVKLKISLQF